MRDINIREEQYLMIHSKIVKTQELSYTVQFHFYDDITDMI